ncbi:MAG: NADH-quinone oxidoreductase subunit E [Bacteroidetes bacterium HGW-Bacteroidetes-6]|jgi:formate hydrogenlyase subunit 3/multisubunit Na+/H+ antiporter MnhD subunit|nr:MAG: NADH-quinone oxidoreductase subunit E [Bacteroidetes bacterium HGW-Bacteroidetes-6]
MIIFVIVSCLLLASVGVFFVPIRWKHVYVLMLAVVASVMSGFGAIEAIGGELPLAFDFLSSFGFLYPDLAIDKLSALFIIVVCIIWIAGLVYARGYLKPYMSTKTSVQISLHLFAYLWLGFSMLLVVIVQDFLSFLIVWELMTLSSFVLVVFDAEQRKVLKAGINYLVQMHVGLFFLITAFLIPMTQMSISSFGQLAIYFRTEPNLPLFILFFVGFGIKAGFVPLHSWLPRAHPAAPSHVSGVMSGVMIKMGIYGILRVLGFIQDDLMIIAIVIIGISLLSGLYGVMQAIAQTDIKKMLAFSSIENIGIIGLGIGLGVLGMAQNNPLLSFLGFSGALLHVVNHSLFKSLLFFSAGSVYRATHSRNINGLGGLIKKMPVTAVFFLIGSIAISALPPFNGFISEFLIYSGLFGNLAGASFYTSLVLIFSIIGLALIGGMALFCFTRVFGIVFLGEPRRTDLPLAVEADNVMNAPMWVISGLILAIGIGSPLLIQPIAGIVSQWIQIEPANAVLLNLSSNLQNVTILLGLFIAMVVFLLLWRKIHTSKHAESKGPTWGCGYTAAGPKLQYTGTSFASNFTGLANPILQMKEQTNPIPENTLFPNEAMFESQSSDVIQEKLIDTPVEKATDVLKKTARMQTGRIEHYILYAFAFMIILFVLAYFNLL